MKSCFSCAYYSPRLYCSNPTSPVHHTYLDLDPVIDANPNLDDEEELAAIGWAEHCDFFIPSEKIFIRQIVDKELLPMEF